MGTLVDGTWVEAPERGHDDQGFDAWIGRTDGDGDHEYPAEPGRYHADITAFSHPAREATQSNLDS